MDTKQFKERAYEVIDKICEYYDNIEKYPVKSQVKPYELFNKLPDEAPDKPDNFEEVMKDFDEIIMPGITHWQSPKFFAYFPSNTSEPSILAEMLISAIAAQSMKWVTSPIAAELEEKVMNWLRNETGLPQNFSGVIQDSATSSTLLSLLTAREKKSEYKINENGFSNENFVVYCSTQTHSSIEKDVKIAGIGKNNLRKISVNDEFSMNYQELEKQIKLDINNGLNPLCIISALGTTSSGAFDSIDKIGLIAKKYNIWFHIDAAYAGSAFILPEYRNYLNGIEYADTYVFNPHKWLFTNFDFSAYFVKDKKALLQTFEIIPEYLKTKTYGLVNDYCDWGIPLGRRFRALKMWFVFRLIGTDEIKNKIQNHIKFAEFFENELLKDNDFQLVTNRNMNIVCFRFYLDRFKLEEINSKNEQLLEKINKTGKIFLSHTKLNDIFTIRFVPGQTYTEKKHIKEALEVIINCKNELKY